MKNLFIVVIALLVVSCNTQKNIVKPPKKFDEINFGSVGGVTGAQKNFLLKANGEVYKIADKVPVKINQISKSDVRKIAKQVHRASFYDITKNKTGNMTYFIDVKAGDFSNKVNWESLSEQKEIIELYKILSNTLKPKSND